MVGQMHKQVNFNFVKVDISLKLTNFTNIRTIMVYRVYPYFVKLNEISLNFMKLREIHETGFTKIGSGAKIQILNVFLFNFNVVYNTCSSISLKC